MKRQSPLDPNTVETLTVTHGAPTDNVVIDDAVEHQSDDLDRAAEANSGHPGKGMVLIPRTTFDRAAVVTTAIKHMIAPVPMKKSLQRIIENYLRDEIADIERRISAERGSGDA